MAIPLGIVGSAFSQVWADRQRVLLLKSLRDRVLQSCFEVADVRDPAAPYKCVKVSDSVEGRRQLRHEADVLRQLRGSPGVVQSHGLFEFQSEGKASLALVLDLYDGSLRGLCEDPALLPEDQAAPIVQQLLGALSNVHAAGFLHRDVKPGNCLIRLMPNQKLELVLADFGLACRAESQDARRRCGTVGFCAPEMLAPDRTPVRMTNKADIFSAGMTVLYLLTKEPPFGTDADALYDRNRNVDIPAPTRQLSAPCLQLLAGLSHGQAEPVVGVVRAAGGVAQLARRQLWLGRRRSS
jgi:serine/threonine protein kinase